jgi:GDP/UDP-N,N'-diacetylbacillosamine 2-epimerase (hydrolysing)
VIEIIGTDKHVYNVGALSFDNFKNLTLLNHAEFESKFGIDISKPSVLITYHPETVDYNKNEQNVDELVEALSSLKNYQLIITMPNADTTGIMVRNKLNQFITSHENAIGIESFGTIGYLTCMKFCKFMLGNTSSGFVEAAYFMTPVINLGLRQKGRIITPNIYNVEEIIANNIINATHNIETKSKSLTPITIYGSGTTSQQIIEILESEI